MKTVSLSEAKMRLSGLAAAAANGESIVITRYGKPWARMVPVEQPRRSMFFGMDRGLVTIADDFDETPPDFGAYIR